MALIGSQNREPESCLEISSIHLLVLGDEFSLQSPESRNLIVSQYYHNSNENKTACFIRLTELVYIKSSTSKQC